MNVIGLVNSGLLIVISSDVLVESCLALNHYGEYELACYLCRQEAYCALVVLSLIGLALGAIGLVGFARRLFAIESK